MDTIRAGIVGASGYTGAELLRLLSQHPRLEITAATSRAEQGRAVDDLFPHLRGHTQLAFTAPDLKLLSSNDVVFFATPHATAMDSVPALLDAGVRVIDLSADFRLRDAKLWAQWYGREHTAPQLLEQAVYGLPEIYGSQLADARLVACPGCYPTSVQLALAPLLSAGAIQSDAIVADCKSGVSGAGRSAKTGSLYCETADNFHPYASTGHRHGPEIDQGLAAIAGEPVTALFMPHLLPQIRGIEASCYAPLSRELDLQELFERFYAPAPFVDVMPVGSHPDTRSVRGSNMARIAVLRRGAFVVVFAVIDNLVKGASGQAVQCMNLMFGFDECTALTAPALLP